MAKTSKNRQQVFALWAQKSKNGLKYFTGTHTDGGKECKVIAFYNQDKKNPKEPDLRIYEQIKKDERWQRGEEITGLWCNFSEKSKKKYLTGKLNKVRLIGFINDSENPKAPKISVYVSEDRPASEQKTEDDLQEHIDGLGDELPF